MKTIIPSIALSGLCCLLANAQTESPNLLTIALSDAGVEERSQPPAPLPTDPRLQLAGTIQALANRPDPERLRALYVEDAEEDLLQASIERLAGMLQENGEPGPSIWFKQLDELPEQSYEFWSEFIKRLTPQEATGVCFIGVPGKTRLTIPIRMTADGLRLIPGDHMADRVRSAGSVGRESE